MKHIKIFEEFDLHRYESHWNKFENWLREKDFDLYDREDIHKTFIEIANNDSLSAEEKANKIALYIDGCIGLYDGFSEVTEYLDELFFDEV